MTWVLLLVVVVLLAVSAFFVAAEFALISARRTVIEPLAVTSGRARATLRAMEDVTSMMACAQLGITLCGVLLGALGEPAVATLLEPAFHAAGVPESWLHPISLAVALLLVVSAHVALGEMVPKNIALAGPERSAMLLAPPLAFLTRLFGPIVRLLNGFANVTVRALGIDPKDEVSSTYTREEVADLVAQSRAEGLLDAEEHQLITSALEFDAGSVDAVMVPDREVVAVDAAVTPAEVERACARTGFSRFPVRDGAGEFRGYVHIRDALGIAAGHRDEPIPAASIRVLPTVPDGAGLRATLEQLRRVRAHLAQVVAPDGTRLGLVMLEDVIEELIGEVRDATRRGPDRRPDRPGAA